MKASSALFALDKSRPRRGPVPGDVVIAAFLVLSFVVAVTVLQSSILPPRLAANWAYGGGDRLPFFLAIYIASRFARPERPNFYFKAIALAYCYGAVMSVLIGLVFPGRWPWWAYVLDWGGGGAILWRVIAKTPVVVVPSEREQFEKLARQGLLTSETFTARRCFRIQEEVSEGPRFFCELKDGRTLYLAFDPLFEYERGLRPEDPVQFPCTQFTIYRYRKDNSLEIIDGTGEALRPEVVAPPFRPEEKGRYRDGQILDRSYDEIKRERMNSR